MRNGRIVFNEEERAKKIYEEGFVKYDFEEILLYTKYCREIGVRYLQVRKELRNKLINIRNENKREGIIESAIKASKRYKLVGKMNIQITKNEIDVIKKLPEKYAKVLFVMLSVAKKDKYDNPKLLKTTNLIGLFYNRGLKSAIKTAKVRINKDEYDHIRYMLDGELGLISATYGNENNWRICFADEQQTDVFAEITDVDNIISFFPYFCENCGNKIIKSNNKKKYCPECAKEKQRITKRDNMRNARDKIKQ